MTTATASRGSGTSNRAIAIAAGLIVVSVIVALIIAFAAGGSDSDVSGESSSLIPQGATRQVSFAEVTGTPLPRYDASAPDPAIG